MARDTVKYWDFVNNIKTRRVAYKQISSPAESLPTFRKKLDYEPNYFNNTPKLIN
jgi:hypothetical protein